MCSPREEVCVYTPRVELCVCVLPPRSCVFSLLGYPFSQGRPKPFGGPKQNLSQAFGAPPPTTVESSVL